MGWIDSLIGWVSPKAACEREAWRLQLQELQRGAGYDAADAGRLNAAWRAHNESADLTDRISRDVIRARARDLERNSDLENAVLYAYKRNVIGRGFTLQPRTGDDELNEEITSLWGEWTKRKNCDVTKTQSLNQMLRMAVTRKKVDGGILFLKCYTKGGLLPFKLQAIEVDELYVSATEVKKTGDTLVNGIEYNQYGEAVGYWIQQYSVDGWTETDPKYYDAQRVIFYFSKKRPSQRREISDMSQTLPRVRDVNEFMTAISVKERIAACLSVFIKKMVPTTGIGRNGQTSVEPRRDYDGKTITPGMIQELNAGDEVETVNPSAGASEATEFLRTQIRMIGAGQGLSYEATARDLSGVTYSSARQGAIEDDLAYQEDIEILQENVMDEIYETFLISAVLAGALDIKDFWDRKEVYMHHTWVASPKKWIDPKKEADANQIALKSGEKTFKQISAEQGKSWKEQINDMAEVAEYAMEKGVTIGTPASGGTTGSTNGGEKKNEKDTNDDDSE